MTLPLDANVEFKCEGCNETRSRTVQEIADNPVYKCSCGRETKHQADAGDMDAMKALNEQVKKMGGK